MSVICPHCKKPIKRTRYGSIPEEIKKKAIELGNQGYSVRDIEYILERQISFASVSRLLKENNDKR